MLQSGQLDIQISEVNEMREQLENEIETHLTYEGENENYNTIFNITTSETVDFKMIKEEYRIDN